FRVNPKIDTETVITELGVGEVLISTLDEKGVPTVVDRAFVVPPVGHIGPITPEQRQALLANSLVAGIYDTAVDRESAFELLKAKSDQRLLEQQQQAEAEAQQKIAEEQAKAEAREEKAAGSSRNDTVFESVTKSVARSASSSIGRQVGNAIVRGVLGSIFGGKSKKGGWF
nr:DUF853 family protein [Pyrinomonadaceae bacterium]